MPFFEGSTDVKINGGTFHDHGHHNQTTNNRQTYNSYAHGSTLNNGNGSVSNEELQRFLAWQQQVSSSTPTASQQGIGAQAHPQIAYTQPSTPGNAERGRAHEQRGYTRNQSYLPMDTQQDVVSNDQYEHISRSPPMSRSRSPQCAPPLTNSVHTPPSSRTLSPPPIGRGTTGPSVRHRENSWKQILEEPDYLSEEPSAYDDLSTTQGGYPLGDQGIPRPHSTPAGLSQLSVPAAHTSFSRRHIDIPAGEYQAYPQNTFDTQGLSPPRSHLPFSPPSQSLRSDWGNAHSAVSQSSSNATYIHPLDTSLSGPVYPRHGVPVQIPVQDRRTTQTRPSASHASPTTPPQHYQSQLASSHPAVNAAALPTNNPNHISQASPSDSSNGSSIYTNTTPSTAVTTPIIEPSPAKPFEDITDPRLAHLPSELVAPTTGPVTPTPVPTPNPVVYLPPTPLDVFAALKPLSDHYMTPVVEKERIRKRDMVKNFLGIKPSPSRAEPAQN
ncbi:hypothetical protein D9756_006341 [Leucocoprinus leucothites]|uniref:Uncharacterized protein n=1 Tax=Leucocoprinus leucothites TaxID=201217 RepID=A0A8H5D3B2_9AGAR|nr:hypothetical protein D9756_006341 [Leucoagaricus leucothites]